MLVYLAYVSLWPGLGPTQVEPSSAEGSLQNVGGCFKLD